MNSRLTSERAGVERLSGLDRQCQAPSARRKAPTEPRREEVFSMSGLFSPWNRNYSERAAKPVQMTHMDSLRARRGVQHSGMRLSRQV